MTKNEMINEIKSIMNNYGIIRLGWVTFYKCGEVYRILNGYDKNIKYEKVSQIQIYLDCIKDYVAKKEETIETEVENNTENASEPNATKKDIIMSLNKNGKAKCDLSTAESLENDGFIIIDRYEDGVLYGFIFWDAIVEEVMDEDEMMVFLMAHGGFENWGEGYKIMKELYSKGYLVDWVEDEENERCYANQNNDKVLSDFCKRLDKLNEAA